MASYAWKGRARLVEFLYGETIDRVRKQARALAVREAREDLSNPVERNTNPGITIEPVIGRDPHRFDGDKDGVGCESG